MSRKNIPNIPIYKSVYSLQAPIAGIGFLLFVVAFQTAKWTGSDIDLTLANASSGYIAGFATAFAGWVFKHLWNGKAEHFIEPDGIWRWISIFALGIIFLSGLAGLGTDLFGKTDSVYKVLFWIGTLVMGLCIGPIIDSADN